MYVESQFLSDFRLILILFFDITALYNLRSLSLICISWQIQLLDIKKMFLCNFIESFKIKKQQTVQAFKPIPKQLIHQYKQNKTQLKYKASFKNEHQVKNNQKKFQNNKPVNTYPAQKIQDLDGQFIMKKLLSSNYNKLCQEYSNTNKLFSDNDFKPCFQSAGPNLGRLVHTWKRVTQIIPNAQFIKQTISPEDILQGQVGTCYFLSSIAALAEHDYRIKNIFPNLNMNKNGFYMARVLHMGVLQQVIVDDYIPVDEQDNPVFARPSGGTQIWVMILEKCWAKLYGSYQQIQGGLPRQVLHAFSGAPTSTYAIPQKKAQIQKLWQEILQADDEKALICSGTIDKLNKDQIGLAPRHAYTIISVQYYPFKMLKLRNPWGQLEYKGRASYSDRAFWDKMSPSDKQNLKQKFQEDGNFYMLWQDFIKYFDSIDICKVNDNANYFYHQDDYKSDEPKLFEFQITTTKNVVMTLSQPHQRSLSWQYKKRPYGTFTFILARQIKQSNKINYQYVRSGRCTQSDYFQYFRDLQSGKYLIYVNINWPRKVNLKATLSVYTQSQVRLQHSHIDINQFLKKTYLNHALNNTQCLAEYPQGATSCTDILLDKCQFGYFMLNVDQSSKRKIEALVDQNAYTDSNIQLLPPYRQKGQFTLIAQPGKPNIFLFKLVSGSYFGDVTIPSPKMRLL